MTTLFWRATPTVSIRAAIAVLLAVPLMVLLGWQVDSPLLKSVMPGFVAMNPATAVCFALAGASLWMLLSERSEKQSRLVQLFAALIVVVALSRLCEYFGWFALGMDQILYRPKLDLETPVNRMAPHTASLFLLMGIGLLTIREETRSGYRPAQILAALSMIVALLAIFGYGFGATAATQGVNFIPMALHTALLFVIWGVAVLAIQSDRGLMAYLTNGQLSGRVARRLLTAALIVPGAVGFLRLRGEQLHFYDTQFGVAITTVATMAILCVVIWYCARSVQLADDEREAAQAELRANQQGLERRVKERTAELSQINEKLQEEITERQRLHEQFLQSQKMEGIGKLAGGIAHDFNNLLTAVIGYSELAQIKLPADSPVQEDINEIRRAGERAADMTRQLLAFARKQVIEPRIVNLGELVVGMQKLVARLLSEDIHLIIEADKDLGQVKVDPGLMEQVIVNLCVNARDAMAHGGKLIIETRNVTIGEAVESYRGSLHPGDYVVLSVSDSGCGMDEQTKAQVFEPFFTTKDKSKGTGLGLSTCYGIVHQNGGHIWVYSEPGQGSTFKVYLPRVAEEADPVASEDHGPQDYSGTETILLVEDEPLVRKLAVRALTEHGYKVLEAENGQDALALSVKFEGQIQLMVTDVVMPHMGGSQLAELMAIARPSMRVLFMSGYTDDAIVHHGVLEGGLPFLQKPFAPGGLARKVREVLDQQIAA